MAYAHHVRHAADRRDRHSQGPRSRHSGGTLGVAPIPRRPPKSVGCRGHGVDLRVLRQTLGAPAGHRGQASSSGPLDRNSDRGCTHQCRLCRALGDRARVLCRWDGDNGPFHRNCRRIRSGTRRAVGIHLGWNFTEGSIYGAAVAGTCERSTQCPHAATRFLSEMSQLPRTGRHLRQSRIGTSRD